MSEVLCSIDLYQSAGVYVTADISDQRSQTVLTDGVRPSLLFVVDDKMFHNPPPQIIRTDIVSNSAVVKCRCTISGGNWKTPRRRYSIHIRTLRVH